MTIGCEIKSLSTNNKNNVGSDWGPVSGSKNFESQYKYQETHHCNDMNIIKPHSKLVIIIQKAQDYHEF